ncbi:MAG: thioredoxin-dependent thiol peroxidase [Verrucomicrobiales bacterium]|nr:thioredoxin-dependent thiol peroxidase [Verrucomicrobiales bacterium]
MQFRYLGLSGILSHRPWLRKRAANRKIFRRGIDLVQTLADSLLSVTDNTEFKVNEGDTAPDFTASTNGGREVSLSQLRGQTVVLYFYPKDNTPGCNKEACGFRDAYEAITGKNAVVLGVSADSAAKHDKFIDKFGLPFTLIADEDKSICEAYGVWGKKSFMGRTFLGIKRMTFLIDADGIVKKVWPKVKVAGHAAEVLAALDEL